MDCNIVLKPSAEPKWNRVWENYSEAFYFMVRGLGLYNHVSTSDTHWRSKTRSEMILSSWGQFSKRANSWKHFHQQELYLSVLKKFWAVNHRQNPLKCHKGLIWQTRKHCGHHLEREGWSNKVSDRNKKIENSVLLINEIEKKPKTWEKCYASEKPNIS